MHNYYGEGMQAFDLGIPVTHNPHDHDTKASDEWYKGWEYAFKQKYIMEHSS